MSEQQKKRRRRKRSKKAELKKKRTGLIVALSIAGVAAVGFLSAFFYAKSTVDAVPQDTVWSNISIDEYDVSGMTETELKAMLEQRQTEFAASSVVLKAEEASAEVLLSDLGFQISNIDALVEQAVSYAKEGGVFSRYMTVKELEETPVKFDMEFKVDSELVKQVIEAQIPELENGAKNATITRANGGFVITDEENGVTVDPAASVTAIETFFAETWDKAGGEIELAITVDVPEITREKLAEIQDVLGTFTTYAGGTGSNRVKNITTGVKLINGAVVMPGEVFSADQAMRPYTKENGFAEAGAYQNGKVIQSMGGGICQVSSTLYNAVILAELGVEQRQPHSMLVDYVKPSMDAAIAGDVKDMKLKNTTEYPIYIEGYVSGGYVTFTIYGKETRPESRSIKFISETISTKDPGKKFEASGDALGTIVKTSSAHTGMEARLWKVVYENGTEVSREVFNTSSYISSPAYYTVGTATDNAEAKAVVTAAIATNDEATIKAAIAQAKAIIEAANKPVEPETPPVTETPAPDAGATTPADGTTAAPAAQAE